MGMGLKLPPLLTLYIKTMINSAKRILRWKKTDKQYIFQFDRLQTRETNGNLVLDHLQRSQSVEQTSHSQHYPDINQKVNGSENPYYVDEEYFNVLKTFHLSDVGYEGKFCVNGSITWVIALILHWNITCRGKNYDNYWLVARK